MRKGLIKTFEDLGKHYDKCLETGKRISSYEAQTDSSVTPLAETQHYRQTKTGIDTVFALAIRTYLCYVIGPHFYLSSPDP